MIESGIKLNILSHKEVDKGLVSKIEEIALSSKSPDWVEEISSSEKTRVYSFMYEGRKFIFKSFLNRSMVDPIKNFLAGSRAIRAMRGGDLITENNFLAPEIICIGDGRHINCGSSFMVTEFIDSNHNVATFFRDIEDSKSRNQMAFALGSLVGSLHKKGVYHGDLRPGNILIKRNSKTEFYFIDNERNRKSNFYNETMAVTNLVQLNMLQLSVIGKTERMRFFSNYVKEVGLTSEVAKRIAGKVWMITERRMSSDRLGGLYN